MSYDLNDLRRHIDQIRTILGAASLDDLARKLLSRADDEPDAEGEYLRIAGIIDSMTPEERRDPRAIDDPRLRRIAQDAGVEPGDVSGLIRQFEAVAAVIDRVAWPAAQGSGIRRARIDRRLSPAERHRLLHRWELLARRGRTPAGQEPWFSSWNRDLRLWDLEGAD